MKKFKNSCTITSLQSSINFLRRWDDRKVENIITLGIESQVRISFWLSSWSIIINLCKSASRAPSVVPSLWVAANQIPLQSNRSAWSTCWREALRQLPRSWDKRSKKDWWSYERWQSFAGLMFYLSKWWMYTWTKTRNSLVKIFLLRDWNERGKLKMNIDGY